MNKIELVLDDNNEFVEKNDSVTHENACKLHLLYQADENLTNSNVISFFPEVTKGKNVLLVSDFYLSLKRQCPDICYLDREVYSDFINDSKAVKLVLDLMNTGHDVIAAIQAESKIAAIHNLNSFSLKAVVSQQEIQ
ncbi:hypothetical protein [Acinetobacter variabilis]|uniref:hypothetical protein n=1 Tax=Acinetobacter variabilis TaxID=70346 RepID=UPI0028A6A3B7|nr:hypothetical protein [Acinetobacter variabilis]